MKHARALSLLLAVVLAFSAVFLGGCSDELLSDALDIAIDLLEEDSTAPTEDSTAPDDSVAPDGSSATDGSSAPDDSVAPGGSSAPDGSYAPNDTAALCET